MASFVKFLALLLIVSFAPPALSQEATPTELLEQADALQKRAPLIIVDQTETALEGLRALRREIDALIERMLSGRETLLKAIGDSRNTVGDLAKQKDSFPITLPGWDTNAAGPDEVQAKLDIPDLPPDVVTNLQGLKALLEKIAVAEQFITENDALATQMTDEKSQLTETLNKVDLRIDELTSTDRSQSAYNTMTTNYGLLLIGGIVVGFFLLSLWQTTRESLFTGDIGFQIITLFTITIAIVIFGLLKLLQASELATLLGGISGYILGKGARQDANAAANAAAGNPTTNAMG